MKKFLIASAILLAALPLTAAGKRVVIVQTNSAGDNVHVIDPATNKVVGVINGIEVNHGAAVAPDGTRIYVSNEADSTLDIVDGKSLKVTNKVKLSGHPNNIAVAKDGKAVVAPKAAIAYARMSRLRIGAFVWSSVVALIKKKSGQKSGVFASG